MKQNSLAKTERKTSAAKRILPRSWRVWVVVLTLALLIGTGTTMLFTTATAETVVDEDAEFHPNIPPIDEDVNKRTGETEYYIPNEPQYDTYFESSMPYTQLFANQGGVISDTDIRWDKFIYTNAVTKDDITVLIIKPNTTAYVDGDETKGLRDDAVLTMPDFENEEDAPWAQWNLIKVYIADGIKSIGAHAFDKQRVLESIATPMSVTSIGAYAFTDCVELKSINLSRVGSVGNYAFSGCSSLKYGHIGTVYSGTITIGTSAFNNTSSYGEVVIGNDTNNIGSIGNSAFTYSGVTNLTIGSGASADNRGTIGESAFSYRALKSVTLGDNLIIGKEAFLRNYSLKTVTIGDNVDVGVSAFYYNYKLQTLQLGSGVTVGNEAFRGCYALSGSTDGSTTLDLSGVISIGNYAFESATKVETITFSDALTTMGSYAFSDCIALTSVNLEDTSLTAIPAYAFQATSLEEVTIPKNVTSIGNFAFSAYLAGNSIRRYGGVSGDTVSNNTETVDGKAQVKAYNYLTTIHFEEDAKLATIGSYAFYRQGLDYTAFTLPASVSSVGAYAFYGVNSVGELTLANPTAVTVSGYAFQSAGVTALHVLADKTFTTGTYAFASNPLVTLDVATTGTLSLGYGTFKNHQYLQNDVTFSAANVTLGNYCFYVDEGYKETDAYQTLQSITFNNASTISVGAYAFAFNMNLSKVFMPALVDGDKLTLGKAAFGDDTDNAYSYQTSLTLGTGVFDYYKLDSVKNTAEYAALSEEEKSNYKLIGDHYYTYINSDAYGKLTAAEKELYGKSEQMTDITLNMGLTYLTGWTKDSGKSDPAEKFSNKETYYAGIDEMSTTLDSIVYPTCTQAGYFRYEMKVKVNESSTTYYYTENVAALGHMYGEYVVKDATCESGEYYCYQCERGKVDSRYGVDEDGYALTAAGTRVVSETNYARCTESGYEKRTETGAFPKLNHEEYAGKLYRKYQVLTAAQYNALSAQEQSDFYLRYSADGGNTLINHFDYDALAEKSGYAAYYVGYTYLTKSAYEKLADKTGYTEITVGSVELGTYANGTGSITKNNVTYSTPFTGYNVAYITFGCYRANHAGSVGNSYAVAYIPMTLKGTTSQTLAEIDLGVNNLQWADPTQSLEGEAGVRYFLALYTPTGNGTDYFKPVEIEVPITVTRDTISLEDVIFRNTKQSTVAVKFGVTADNLPTGLTAGTVSYFEQGAPLTWQDIVDNTTGLTAGRVQIELTYRNAVYDLLTDAEGTHWKDGRYNVTGTDLSVASVTNLGSGYSVESVTLDAETETVTIVMSHEFSLRMPSLDLIEITADNVVYDGKTHGMVLTNVPGGSTLTFTPCSSTGDVTGTPVEMTLSAVAAGLTSGTDLRTVTRTDLVTDAGTYYYKVHVTNPAYTGTYDTVVAVVIEKAPVALPEEAIFEYDGTTHTGYAATDLYTVAAEAGNTLSAVNAGTYTVTLRLITPTNYKWEGTDGTQRDSTRIWTVRKLTVAVPTVDGDKTDATYNTKYQSPLVLDAVDTVSGTDAVTGDYRYSYDGNDLRVQIYLNGGWRTVYTLYDARGIAVGNYTIRSYDTEVASGLTDTENFVWPNAMQTFTFQQWSITKTDITLPTINIPAAEYTGRPYAGTITLGGSWDLVDELGHAVFNTTSDLVFSYYDAFGRAVTPTEVGMYTVKIDVSGYLQDSNYNAITEKVVGVLQISKARLTLEAPAEQTYAYDGQTHTLPAPIFRNGDGEIVTFTAEDDVDLRYYLAAAEDVAVIEEGETVTRTNYVRTETAGTLKNTISEVKYSGGEVVPYLYMVEIDSNCASYVSENMVPVIVTITKADQGITITKVDESAEPTLQHNADGSYTLNANLCDKPLELLLSGEFDKNSVLTVNGITGNGQFTLSDDCVVILSTTSDLHVMKATVYFVGMADNLTFQITTPGTSNASAAACTVTVNVAKAKANVMLVAKHSSTTYSGKPLYNVEVTVAGTNVISPSGAITLPLSNPGDYTLYYITQTDYNTYVAGKSIADEIGRFTTTQPVDVGDYYAVACYGGDDNYAVTYSEPAALTITKAKLTVKATPYTATYDGQDHAPATFTVTGVGGTVITDYSLTFFEGNSSGPITDYVKDVKDSGSYAYSISVPNYETVIGSVNVTIQKRKITTVIEDIQLTKVYDGTNVVYFGSNATSTTNVTWTNAVGNEITGISATAVYAGGDAAAVGNVTVYYELTGVDGFADNYLLNNLSIASNGKVTDAVTYYGAGKIAKRQITVTDLYSMGRQYDGSTHVGLTGTPAADNILPGDTVTLTLKSNSNNYADAAAAGVGTHAVTVDTDVIELGGADAPNYEVVYVDVTDVSIIARQLTVSMTDVTKTYTGLTVTDYKTAILDRGNNRTYNDDLATVMEDMQALEKSNLIYTFCSDAAGKNEIAAPTAAGTYYMKVSLDGAANYWAEPVIVKLTIAPATLSVTPVGYTGVYDAAAHIPATFTVKGTAADGTLATDKYTVKFYTTATDRANDVNAVANVKNVAQSGTYYYTVTAANYEPAYGEVTVTVTPKNLTITNSGLITAKTYDGSVTAAVGSAAVTGTAGSESVTAVAGAAYNSKNVASATTITVTYTMTFANGADAGNYTYTAGSTVAAAFVGGKATETVSGTISKYQLHVTGGITANNRVWDGTTIVTLTDNGITFNDIVSGETLTLTLKPGTVATISDATVSSYAAHIDPADVAIAGTTADNYEVVSVFTPSVTISRAKPTFTLPLVTVAGYSAKPVESGYYAVKVHANDEAKTILVQGTETDIVYTFWKDENCTIPAVDDNESVVPTNRLDQNADVPYYVKARYIGDTNHDEAEVVFELIIEKAGFNKLGSSATPYVAVYDGKTHGVISSALILSSLADDGPNKDSIVTSTTDLYVIQKTDASANAPAVGDDRWVLAFEKGVPVADVVSMTDVGSAEFYVKLVDTDHTPYVLPTTITAQITPATLTISSKVTTEKVYDGTTTAATTDVVVTGAVNGENVTLTAQSDYVSKNVGTKMGITTDYVLTFTGCKLSNYTVDTSSNGLEFVSQTDTQMEYRKTRIDGTITQKQVTVYGASATDRAYNSTALVNVFGKLTVTDLCPGDDLTLVFASNAYGTTTDVIPGTYSLYINPIWVTKGGTDAANYEIVFVDQPTIRISKADYDTSGLSFNDITPTYDGLPHHPVVNGTLPTGLDGIQVTVSYDVSATDVADGTVTVTATFATASGNYNAPAPVTATVIIKPADLTVDTTGYSGTYDGAGHSVLSALTVTGVANDGDNGVLDACAYTIAVYRTAEDRENDTGRITTVTDVADSGTYYYRVTSPNYNTKDGTFTVTINRISVKAEYVLDLVKDARVYDATNIVTVSGTSLTSAAADAAQNALIAGELGISATATFDNKNVGTNKTITVVYTITTLTDAAKLNNYWLSSKDAVLGASWSVSQYGNVTKKQIAVTGADAVDFVYNAKPYVEIDAASALTTTDLIAGDDLTLSVATGKANYATTGNSSVGTYGVTVTDKTVITLGGADAANYEVVSVACSDVTISRADVTVNTPNTLTVPYSGTAVLPQYYVVKASGVSGDPFVFPISYTFNGSAVTPTDAGKYTVAATIPTTTNYNAKTETYTLTIEAYDQPIGFTADGYGEHVYDGETHKAVVVSDILGVNQTALGADKYTIYYSVKPSGTQPAASFTDTTLWSTTATDVKHVADTGMYWFAIVAPNYNTLISYKTVTINRATVYVLTTITDTKVYDKTTSAVVNDVALTGVAASDAANVTIAAVAAYQNANAGNPSIVVNYTVVFGEGTTITDYRYDDTDAVVNGSVATFQNTFNGTITPAPITVTIHDQTGVYNRFERVISQTDWAVTSGTDYDNRDLGIKLTKENGACVGEYAITGVSSNKNYTVTFVNGTYTVTPKKITVKINPTSGIYGDTPVLNKTLLTTADPDGAIEIDALRQDIGKLVTSATNLSNIGKYILTVTTDTNTSHVYHDYEVTFDVSEAFYTVERRPLTITADSAASRYNANITDITYKTNKGDSVGLCNGDVLAVVINAYTDASCTDLIGTLTDVGEYYVRIDGYTVNGKTGTATNYAVTLVDSGAGSGIKYTVQKAKMQVNFTNSLPIQSVLFGQTYANPLTFLNESSGRLMNAENGNAFNGLIEYWLENYAGDTVTLSDIASVDAYGNVVNYMDSKSVVVHARVSATNSDCNYEIPAVSEFTYTLVIGQAINYNVVFYVGGGTIASGSDRLVRVSGYVVKASDFPTLEYVGRTLVGWKNMGTGEIKTAAEWGSANLQVLSDVAMMAVWEDSTLDVEPIPAQTYTNLLLTPDVVVYCEGKLLTAGVDYLVFYNNNVNAGTDAVASVVGIGVYTGLSTETNFTINKAQQKANFESVQHAGILIGTQYENCAVVGLDTPVIHYYSSDTNIATVDEFTGIVTAVAAGRTVIYAVIDETANVFGTRIEYELQVNLEETGEPTGSVSNDLGMPAGTELVMVRTDLPASFSDLIGNKFKLFAADTSIIINTYSQDQLFELVSGAHVLDVLDISLESGGVTVNEFTGTYTVKVLIPPTYRSAADVQIVHINDLGQIELFETKRVGDYLFFDTTHFSEYIVIGKIDIALEPVYVSGDSEIIYQGREITADDIHLRVTDTDHGALVEGVDYRVSYLDNVNAGTATVVITGIGKYGNFTTFTTLIKPATLTDAMIAPIADQVYTGSLLTPEITVQYLGSALTAGVDYTATYTNAGSLGTVTITGQGNFTGSASATFAIEKRTNVIKVTITDLFHVYDGTPKGVTTVVTYNGMLLVSGTDYTVTYEGGTPINVGSYIVTVEGIGSYADVIQKSVLTISPATSDVFFDASSVEKTYTPGGVFTKAVIVSDSDNHGTITYVSSNPAVATVDNSGNVVIRGAGTATITATVAATENYKEQRASYTLTVNAAGVGSLTLGAIANQVYTGTAVKPDVLLQNGSVELTEGKDYRLSYSSNVAIGTATVTITGIGNYSGSRSATFKIVANTNAMTASRVGSYTYTGKAITPKFSVYYAGKGLQAGVDYLTRYLNNVNAGMATINVTGVGDYSGCELTINFAITAADLSGADLSVADAVFTGSAVTPAASAAFGGSAMTAGNDYVVYYSDNLHTGTGTATFVGQGNFTGVVVKHFTLQPAQVSGGAVIVTLTDMEYTGAPLTPAPEVILTATGEAPVSPQVTIGGRKLTAGTDYTVTYVSNTDVGTAGVEIVFIGDYAGRDGTTFEIVPRTSGLTAEVGKTTFTCDGAAHEVPVTVTYGDKTLTPGTDYKVTYNTADGKAPTHAGTYEMIVEGTGNYAGVIERVTVTIAKAAPAVTFTPDVDAVWGAAPVQMVYSVTGGGEVSFTTDNPGVATIENGIVTITGVGTAHLTMTVAETADYLGASVTRTVTVAAKDLGGVTVEIADEAIYNGKPVTPDVVVRDGDTVLVEGRDYILTCTNNVGVGTANVTVTGIGNYAGEVLGSFDIKANAYTFTVEPIADAPYTGAAVAPVPVVSYAGVTLTEGVDYTCTYSSNVAPGTGCIVINGLGAYSGCSAVVSFTIKGTSVTSEMSGENAVWGTIECASGFSGDVRLVILEVEKPAVAERIDVRKALLEGTLFSDLIGFKAMRCAYEIYIEVGGELCSLDDVTLDDEVTLTILPDGDAWDNSLVIVSVGEDGSYTACETTADGRYLRFTTDTLGTFCLEQNHWIYVRWYALALGIGLTALIVILIAAGSKRKKAKKAQKAAQAEAPLQQ